MTIETTITLDKQDRALLRLLLEGILINPVSAQDCGILSDELDSYMARLMDLGLDFEVSEARLISGFGGQMRARQYELHADSLPHARELYAEATGGVFISAAAAKTLQEAMSGYGVNDRKGIAKLQLPPTAVKIAIQELEAAGVRFDCDRGRPEQSTMQRLELPRWRVQPGSRKLAERLIQANEEPAGG